MSARITTCLHCNHTAAYKAFEQNAVGFSRMKCPKCGSTSRFATNAAAEQSNDQPASNVTAASAAASDAQPEESDMATEAPTKKRAAKPEQGQLIETSDPEHKELDKLVKAYRKITAERSEVLGDLKQRLDNAAEKVVTKMSALGLKEYVRGDVEVTLDDGAPVLTVKTRKTDSDDDESEE